MEAKAKQDVASGAVAQSLVDNRGSSLKARVYIVPWQRRRDLKLVKLKSSPALGKNIKFGRAYED